MDKTVVRRAALADARSLARLRWQFKEEDSSASPISLDDFIVETTAWFAACFDGGWVAWVVDLNGDLCGHVFLRVVDKVPSPYPGSMALGYVTNFYVAPQVRNRGLGASLLEALQTWADGAGLDTLVVWPSDGSIPVWRRAGYAADGDVLELAFQPS